MKLFFLMLGLILLVSCENLNRSLVFSTGTNIGVEVVIADQTGQPGKVIIGYKRAEVLFDPIIEDKNTSNDAAIIKENAHSVIAKLQGSLNNSTVSGSIAQWFASGEAAKILAKHGAPALTDNPEVAKAVSKTALGSNLNSEGEPPLLIIHLVENLYNGLANNENLAKSKEGERLISLFNNSTLLNEIPKKVTTYIFDSGKKELTLKEANINSSKFDKFQEYRTVLYDEIIDPLESAYNFDGQISLHGQNVTKDFIKSLLSDNQQKMSMLAKVAVKDPNIVKVFNSLAGNGE